MNKFFTTDEKVEILELILALIFVFFLLIVNIYVKNSTVIEINQNTKQQDLMKPQNHILVVKPADEITRGYIFKNDKMYDY